MLEKKHTQREPYLIVGRGQVATQWRSLFEAKKISYQQWHRHMTTPFSTMISQCATVLLAISDQAIIPFLEKNQAGDLSKFWLHFSGSLHTEKAFGYHPLMTLNHHILQPEIFEKILFVAQDDAPAFRSVFPKLKNPSLAMNASQKSLYHALCVMANNFSTMLWQTFYQEMTQKFKIPKAAIDTFLYVSTQNVTKDPERALTGPFVRQDHETIQKNLSALQGQPHHQIYQSFLAYYLSKQPNIEPQCDKKTNP